MAYENTVCTCEPLTVQLMIKISLFIIIWKEINQLILPYKPYPTVRMEMM